ncbi:meiotic recombination directing protein [Saccharomycopsis crataegensis]|uniref:Meiotic recombination directing protein n=1 Tax=Saccharomycopsis crataegensis TaxID=43959 RepID=A0AAV5QJ79_9ASCO|nr:meiotic recombination directing protein [Saccharomycopsis crataegensis]
MSSQQSSFLDVLSLHQPISFFHVQLSVSFFVTVVLPIAYYIYTRHISSQRLEKAVKFEAPMPDEAKPHWKGKRLNPPTIIDPQDPKNIQGYCPATAQFLGKFKCSSRDDMDAAIKASKKAQKSWAKTSFAQRRQVLRSLSEYILKHQEEIARVAARDTGKTALCASMGEILVTNEKLNWIIKHGEKALQPSKRPGPSNILMSYKGAEVRYEPLAGVCAALISWNYPFHNLMGPLIASIFTGNGIVIKCSEHVVWSSTYFLEIARAALLACGHDLELVQLVYCWPNDADYFTSHPGLSHITFIGSKPVAHHVVKAASESLTPVVVELGGKDPFIVLDDVKDVEAIASIIMRGTFQSSGQNCIGIERIIAMPKVYDQLVAILEKRIQTLRLGSDIDQLEEIDMGGMITDTRFDSLEKIIETSVDQGAKLVYGGKRYVHPNYPQGHYFTPTLLVDVTPDMAIATDECFAPICTVMKANDVDDAIDIANSTEYGLGASVFSNNYATCNYVADSLKAGNVAINDFATFYVCQLPFGGVKGSGYGKFGGEEGLRGLCVEKSVCYDKIPFVSTKIPKPLDYPIPDGKKAWEFVSALNVAGYSISLWERIKALGTLSRNA